MKQALLDAGVDDGVLAMPDDLSCGPIAAGDIAERVAWWADFHDVEEVERRLSTFWQTIATTPDKLVVWYSRNTAKELSFFHACVARLGDRPWGALDVTERSRPARVSIMPPDTLRSLLGQEKPLSPVERHEAVERWSRLRSENAPFRIVTPTGLESSPVDSFDDWLLANVSDSPRKVHSLIADAMGEFSDQVGDIMLEERVAALVARGSLLADADLSELRSAHVSKPPSTPA